MTLLSKRPSSFGPLRFMTTSETLSRRYATATSPSRRSGQAMRILLPLSTSDPESAVSHTKTSGMRHIPFVLSSLAGVSTQRGAAIFTFVNSTSSFDSLLALPSLSHPPCSHMATPLWDLTRSVSHSRNLYQVVSFDMSTTGCARKPSCGKGARNSITKRWRRRRGVGGKHWRRYPPLRS